MAMERRQDQRFEGLHCSLVIQRPAANLIVLVFQGIDAGELGDAPFRALADDLRGEQLVALFIDARDTSSASISVSGEWAAWLGRHRERFDHISMLSGSRFIQLTAELVRRFAELGDVMRIYTDPAAFDRELSDALAEAASRGV